MTSEADAAVYEFLHMGGYAAYVWSAFGFTLVVLLGLLIQSWRAAHRREEELGRLRHLVRPAARPRPVVRRPERPAEAAPAARRAEEPSA